MSPELKFNVLLCLLFLSYLFAEHHLFAFQALLRSKLLVVKNNCDRERINLFGVEATRQHVAKEQIR